MGILPPNTLFDIFEQDDLQVYKEHGLDELVNTPYIRLGLVVTGVDNYKTIDMLYTRKYPTQYEKVRETIKFKYYYKLYTHLVAIPLNEVHILYNRLVEQERIKVNSSLHDLLRYFETQEHFHECAKIFKYLQKLPQK